MQYLAALGHRRIARVAGVGELRAHGAADAPRSRRATRDLGLDGEVVETDYSAEQGARATRQLLSSPEPPTAIIFDSDLLAVTGLGVAQQMGFSVPDDLSIVGWDDSLISQVVHPPLTALTRDIEAYGVAATRHLLARSRARHDERRRDVARRAHAARQHRPPARLVALIAEPARPFGNSRLTLNRISDWLLAGMNRSWCESPVARREAESNRFPDAAPSPGRFRRLSQSDHYVDGELARQCVDSPDRKERRGGSTQCYELGKEGSSASAWSPSSPSSL